MSEILSIYEIADLNKNTITAKDNFSFINYLDTSNLTKNKVDSLQFLESEFPSRAKRKVTINTILYSTVRPNQEHFGIIENQIADNLIASTGFTTIDIVSSNINVKYLYYKLTQPFVTNYLQGIAENSVSAYPSIKPEAIGNLRFSFPDLSTQQKIASLLSTIDDKIELNNRINDNLEQMAKTLYDYWFVQFDFPDENGKPYKSSGNKMVWNEVLKRDIPIGWELKTIGDYCKSRGGFAFKSSWWTTFGESVIKIKDIQENSTLNLSDLSLVNLEGKNIDDKFKAKAGDIVIAMTGATVGKYAIVPNTNKQLYVNQRVGYFDLGLSPTIKLPYLINSLNQKYFREAIFTLASGAAQPNISNEQINSIQLLMPTNQLIENFNSQLKSSYDKILNNQNENQQLSSLRDWLLPMLMNGQVKVE